MIGKKIVVIGGGAAGMIAAARAGELGAEVVLLEKNKMLGRKLSISGKGRCNITNIGEIKDFIDNYPGNGQFLYSALHSFSNQKLMTMLEELGLEVKAERGGRVFPVSDKASDVIDAFAKYLKSSNVEILLEESVLGLIIENETIMGVKTEKGFIEATGVIVATGGKSYPATGSTGDGYRWAEQAGHNIVKIRPALVPLNIKEEWVKGLQGLSLKNVEVSIYDGEKLLQSEFGEMLFTHFGVSGPVVLTLSRRVVEKAMPGSFKLKINLKPALTEEMLDNRLQRDFIKFQKKQLKNALHELLPRRMIDVLVELSGIDQDKFVHQITKEERKKLREIISALTITVEGPRSLAEAIVTAGGVSLKEISPRTMESKLVKGLYFAGEVLDIDGYTGGYNLQAAFSTGYAAGQSAAKAIETE